jgi:branched-chain amino acid transport system permease protein
MLAQQLVNGLVLGTVYALFAVGFTLIFGVNRILNLAHGSIFMVGAFTGLFMVVHLKLPFPVALLAAMAASGILSVIVDRISLAPLRKRNASEFAPIISTIGLALIVDNIAQRLSDSEVLRYPFGTFPIRIFRFGLFQISLLQATIAACALVLTVALVLFLRRSMLGKSIRAVAGSERTAMLLGIRPEKVYVLVFFISGAMAGAAGVLVGIAFNTVDFLMGEPYLLRGMAIIVLGGMGSILGAFVGGLLLGILQTLTISYISSDLSDIIPFLTIFVMLLWRPSGLFGSPVDALKVGRR